jgi:hypothetical protein
MTTCERCWFLGVAPWLREEQLSEPTISVVRNGPDLADYCGATVVFRPPACVLAVPADWYEPVVSRVGQRPPAEVFDTSALRQVFGAAAGQVIGPASLGYADASDFRPAPAMGARLLSNHELPELDRLAAVCGPVAWEHSGIDPARPPDSIPVAPTSHQSRSEHRRIAFGGALVISGGMGPRWGHGRAAEAAARPSWPASTGQLP